MKREDDFERRRAHLKDLSDEELHARFWRLAEALTEPMLRLGRENSSPAIERSVLLRMGFSSLEAQAIAAGCAQRGLLRHGAGHVVLRLSRKTGLMLREAGLALAEGRLWDEAERLFGEEGEA